MGNIEIRSKSGVKKIGAYEPVFIVAEMSGNHNQSLDKALAIIDAAAEAGADAIKIQTYTADTITIDCDNEYFQMKGGEWGGQTLYQLYEKAYTPWDWEPKLQEHAEKRGLVFFSSPFDGTAVDFLEKMNVPLYKIASFEVVDIPLLKKVGATRKPVIMSRGMATWEELKLAVETLRKAGAKNIAVLHCISSYPAKPEEMNLLTIPDIEKKLGVVAGLSDHSLGYLATVEAVALGAKVIEKHLTISRAEGGPDATFSLEPDEFKELVEKIRQAESALGQSLDGPGLAEEGFVKYRKSLFVVKDIKAGEKFTPENIRSIRPGMGLAPKHYEEILGKIAAKDLERGTPLAWDLIK